MGAQFILLLLAVVCFLIGAIDYPPASSSRMACLGLMFVALAQLVGAR